MFFAVNKPKGISSNGLLNKIRKIANTKKVGHGGTLDPLASGVLVVAIGRESTKKLTSSIRGNKEYVAEVFLGATSTTDDEEGEKDFFEVNNPPKLEEIKKILSNFIGEIMQRPPIFSALKIKGKRAYEYAREGKDLKLEVRPVTINDIEVLQYEYPVLKIRVESGSGVYIRSLARDIGESLGTGAYLKNLIRTKVGDFNIDEAILEEDLESFIAKS